MDPMEEFLAREQQAMKDLDVPELSETLSPTVSSNSSESLQAPVLPPPIETVQQPISEPAVPAPRTGSLGSANVSSANTPKVATESEAIKEWRAKFEARIAEVDRLDALKHAEIIEKAQKDLAMLSEKYEREKAAKAASLQVQSAASHSLEQADLSWKQVSEMVDMMKRPKGSMDISRFKEILASIKDDVKVPI